MLQLIFKLTQSITSSVFRYNVVFAVAAGVTTFNFQLLGSRANLTSAVSWDIAKRLSQHLN